MSLRHFNLLYSSNKMPKKLMINRIKRKDNFNEMPLINNLKEMPLIKYPFNYTDDPHGPTITEELVYTNICFNIYFENPYYICYTFNNAMSESASYCDIKEPVEMLLLSTTNPAHSLGEFTSFLEYYNAKTTKLKVCINAVIAEKMPYLYQLIQQFFPSENCIIIVSNTIYHFHSIIMRRNHHFMYSINWRNIPYISTNNILHFSNLQPQYLVNCDQLFNKAKEIYETHKHKYSLSDTLMIIKTTKEKYSVSIHRALEYPTADIIDLLVARGVKIVEISQFSDIFEYICTIYHAKNIIFSYGGPMCTNRFFCNPAANIIVLANLHYKHEYNLHYDPDMYPHLRFSMIAPVKNQHFLLDFDNRLTIENSKQFLSLLV